LNILLRYSRLNILSECSGSSNIPSMDIFFDVTGGIVWYKNPRY
jgi:hypothetical protein